MNNFDELDIHKEIEYDNEVGNDEKIEKKIEKPFDSKSIKI